MSEFPEDDPVKLADLLADQEQAVALIQRAAVSVYAPAGLRARVSAARRSRPRRRRALATGLAAAAAIALALFLALPSGVGGPSVAAAAALAERPATAKAPRPLESQPKLLNLSVGGVAFPNWTDKFGWRPTGSRSDVIGGRGTGTLFYAKQGHRVAYTIVAGSALHAPHGADEVHRNGVELYTFVANGRLVVTWLRRGETCVLTGPGVGRATLLKLADWKGNGSIAFD